MSDTFDHEADALDSLNDDEDDRCYSVRSRRPRCRNCGAVCNWIDTGERWALQNPQTGRLHVCNITDEFDNLDEATP